MVQIEMQEVLKWAHEHQLYATLSPMICGICLAFFSYMLVYLDSDVPGLNPPSPFSPVKQTYFRERRSALHLGYIIALASGLIVTIFLYCDFSSVN
ncbi:ADP-ribosylation factor-like protein 6-interacting protein 6 isoform X2 [Bactrocera neohumeralis]|nr:ADP-ribosylation factor-like protein 6-interacting protein 6 isoform X2 [Bactrocera tryoni]XP_039956944.1 ADP-ribosylation factor-like protein 6-interacting protein 6 isoform X2 [Bactrocera tryoni]XP_039956945.1 ADP-ribosylation factor-like protein 6-interacting protein 6 isoform X2 [Bactrocera tryoni]XP_050325804.1 ADP-ribosylation factor-like protein 6-interacting protein 6 isoform X2 [Bactrocera neohumeralis]XP_050325805.1 ADP-ribosylation factor-like protein 6-interacting protein 6 isofo